MATTLLIVVVGPTASGKTALGIELAQRYGGEIICADSRTVYRHMDIGTAKPTTAQRAAVPHHLLDIVEPDQQFTAADFKVHAQQAIDAIAARGKVPIMVGGTGLYVDGVVYDYQFGSPADPAKRRELDAMSVEALQELCKKSNIQLPLNSGNKRHLVRAIEQGGVNQQRSRSIRSNTIMIGLRVEPEILAQRIAARAQQMFAEGVVDEATKLAGRYGWQGEPMSANIYQVIHGFIEGDYDYAETMSRFMQSDRQLAKRQMTWFRRNHDVVWVDSPADAIEVADEFVWRQSAA